MWLQLVLAVVEANSTFSALLYQKSKAFFSCMVVASVCSIGTYCTGESPPGEELGGEVCKCRKSLFYRGGLLASNNYIEWCIVVVNWPHQKETSSGEALL